MSRIHFVFDFMDKISYFKSLVDSDLEKFIIDHIDEDDETLLKLCIKYLEGGDINDSC